MTDGSDPRVFFAAERTVLAWLRTGISIVGLGFVVSKFGLFLRVMGHQPGDSTSYSSSTAVGVGLVVLGGLTMAGATVQHMRFVRRLGPSDLPAGYWGGFASWVSATAAVAAAILAAYLLVA